MVVVIHYIATKKEVVKTLSQYFETQSVKLEPLEPPFLGGEYLLIIEPVAVEKKYFALSTVWKPWLFEKYPDTRLIFAGFGQSAHPCFLNLLDLPTELKKWLELAPKVSDFEVYQIPVKDSEKSGIDIYIDTWNRRLPLTGRDMRRQLLKFTEGHDKANSFFQQIARLRKIFVDLRFLTDPDQENVAQFSEDIPELIKEAQTEWETLEKRWKYYQPSFAQLPFTETYESIRGKMLKLGKMVKEPEDTQRMLPECIQLTEDIRDQIRFELKRYISVDDRT